MSAPEAIYAHVAVAYLASGLGGPIPLPPARKKQPPKGYTGRHGAVVGPTEVRRWCRRQPATNVALRLAPGLLGIDVDAYPPKQGGMTFLRLLELHGPLPATVRSTSREDGVSGIYLFQVPEGLGWPGEVTARHEDGVVTRHVDLIHFGHRYAMVWPSRHPEGRDYRWLTAEGVQLDAVPNLGDVPWLPSTWLEALKPPPPVAARGRKTSPRTPTPSMVSRVEESCRTSPPTRHTSGMARRLLAGQVRQVRSAQPGSRNDALNRAAYTLAGVAGLDRGHVRQQLLAVVVADDLTCAEASATFDSAWAAGAQAPLT